MKKVLGTMLCACITLLTAAQVNVQGKVTDSSGKSLSGAAVFLFQQEKKIAAVVADESGRFTFRSLTAGSSYSVTAQFVGFKESSQTFTAGSNQELNLVLLPGDYLLEPFEVISIRASSKAPFTKTDLSAKQIQAVNLGQDIPFILNQTPSVIVNSDAGNGVGYTGIRIRGTDATRINVTLNGIPYNDAESQGTYFVDVPDLASSLNSIQVQRGVGTSTNGSGAFGATINLSTNQFHDKAYAEVNNSYGSFNTWKNTLMVGSGLISDHFTIDARLSNISSDGYIDRASSKLQSLYFSPAYTTDKMSIRLNVITGKEKTYQAWYGVPEAILATNRTYNAAGTEKPGDPYDNQTDNYQQDHYQLFYNQTVNSRINFNIASFLTRGKGYYEEYKAEQYYTDYGLENPIVNGAPIETTDLVRQRWLNNYFYGQVFSLQLKTKSDELTWGGSWSSYNGKHYGNINWASNGNVPVGYRYYNYPATKSDINVYTKWQHYLSATTTLFADVQYRHVTHNMDGFEGNPDLFVKRSFDFLNPKAGISYFKNNWHVYLSYALAHKEPNRDDFQAALTEQPVHETLHDVESGVSYKTGSYNLGATLYYMYYKNQLVLTGKINDVGSYTRTNVPSSYRTGVEFEANVNVANWLSIGGSISVSRNRIKSFTEYIDDFDNNKQEAVTHQNTAISFSPGVVGAANINITPAKNVSVVLTSKYVSRQYMDNTGNISRSIDPYYVQDAKLSYSLHPKILKEINLIAQVNNAFNKKYVANGYTYPYYYGGELVNDNYYYPMAGINFIGAVQIKL